ncbi:TRAP transporter small permease subunit [bacterium]|nr:TRAP transporter small permease subunit [bacterium]
MKVFVKLHRALNRLEVWAVVALMLACVAVILLQIVDTWISRLFDEYHSHAWTQELALLLFVWLVFLGASLGVQARAHFGIDLVVKALPAGGRRAATLLAALAMLLVIGVLIAFGVELCADGLKQTFSTLSLFGRRLPRTTAYLAIPVSGALMLRYVLILAWQELRGGGRPS